MSHYEKILIRKTYHLHWPNLLFRMRKKNPLSLTLCPTYSGKQFIIETEFQLITISSGLNIYRILIRDPTNCSKLNCSQASFLSTNNLPKKVDTSYKALVDSWKLFCFFKLLRKLFNRKYDRCVRLSCFLIVLSHHNLRLTEDFQSFIENKLSNNE